MKDWKMINTIMSLLNDGGSFKLAKARLKHFK